MADTTTTMEPATDVTMTEHAAPAATNEDEHKSKVIMNLERTIREQSQKLAAYQAEEEYKLRQNREDMRKQLQEVPNFFNAVKASLPDQEQASFNDDMIKAQTFLESVPAMDKIDMARHAPLVTVACKASGTLIAMDNLRKENQDKDLALKRALESGEEKDKELAKRQKDIDYLTQLAENRQSELEKQVKEYQDLVTRVSRHDFSAPATREYNSGIEAMRKHTASQLDTKTTIASPTTTKTATIDSTESTNQAPQLDKSNGKAPVMATGMSASERALLGGIGGVGSNGLTTTTLNASAGSAGSSSNDNSSHNGIHTMHDHVRSLRDMVLSNSKPSTQVFSVPSARGASNPDAQMSDAERILSALR